MLAAERRTVSNGLHKHRQVSGTPKCSAGHNLVSSSHAQAVHCRVLIWSSTATPSQSCGRMAHPLPMACQAYSRATSANTPLQLLALEVRKELLRSMQSSVRGHCYQHCSVSFQQPVLLFCRGTSWQPAVEAAEWGGFCQARTKGCNSADWNKRPWSSQLWCWRIWCHCCSKWPGVQVTQSSAYSTVSRPQLTSPAHNMLHYVANINQILAL